HWRTEIGEPTLLRRLHLRLLGRRRRLLRRRGLRQDQPVTGPRADVVLLQVLPHQLHRDGPPAAVGIRLWIVAERVEMSEVVAYGFEGLLLILPVLGEVGLAAGRLAHALEDSGRN